MQGKGIVKLFLGLGLLVCLTQLFYTFPTGKVERNAESFAAAAAGTEGANSTVYKAARSRYLDSMSSEVIMNIPYIANYTYQDLKARQLGFGLDLKGGMSVVLQVNLQDFLSALVDNADNPEFKAALASASAAQKVQQSDFITLFAEAWKTEGKGAKMATLFSRNASLRDKINFQSSDGDVTRLLRTKADETVSLTYDRLKERIDKLGVVQPNITLDEARDLILVELPGIDNPERARTYLQAAAKLEFWNVYRVSDAGVVESLNAANDKLKSLTSGSTAAVEVKQEIERIDTVFAVDSLGNLDLTSIAKIDTIYKGGANTSAEGPLFNLLKLNTSGALGLSPIGTAAKNQRSVITEMLANPALKGTFPQDIMFRWSKDPILDPTTLKATGDYELYAIRKDRGKDVPPLEGDRVTDAYPTTDPNTGQVAVSLQMDREGAKTWGRMTTNAANDNNREIAILLDDEVVSAPRVLNPITGGSSSITGNYNVQSAKDLSNILQVGKLPARTEIIQESLVGPSLGKENISRSINAILIGFGLVVLFMITYYMGAGIVSILALALNLIFIFASLASVGTVLTLPGIAGIVLTIGMAVDANVIIFERIREELRAGKSTKEAVSDGFNFSYSAIIDANVTTLLTAIVLMYFGLGPIKGFAIVLFIGVLSSLFTAVLATHLMIDYWVNTRNKALNFWAGWSENMMADVNFDWMSKRKIGYMISGTLFVISLVSMAVRGFDLGVDFKGGYSYNVEFADAQINAQQLREVLKTKFDGREPVVKAVDASNTFNITTSYLISENTPESAETVTKALFDGVNQVAGGKLNYDNFKRTDQGGVHIITSSKVGATIADDIYNSSLKSTFFALLLIFLYLAVRFSNWRFSMGAVAALFHDVVITLGVFSLFYGILPFSMEIDQAMVAAILTVIGYSVNDTVIVFDRIREYINSYTGRTKEEIFNLAINSTLSRTLITSGTTLVVVIALFLFGGSTLKGFAFALLVGIGFGTYSSIFIASAFVNDLLKELKGKEVKNVSEKSEKIVAKAK